MARVFDGSTQYLGHAGAAVSARPLTLAAWCKVDTSPASTYQVAVSLGSSSDASEQYTLGPYRDGSGNENILFQVRDDATKQNALTSTQYATGAWHHLAGTVHASASTNAISVYLDGGGKGQGDFTAAPDNINYTSIGAHNNGGSISTHLDGMIAEAAIWDVALTDDQVAALAAGVLPGLVRPESLVAWHRLLASDHDTMGASDLTAYGSPTWSTDHAPIWTPQASIVVPGGPPPAGTVPAPYYHLMHGAA